jgi:hypothetical protein
MRYAIKVSLGDSWVYLTEGDPKFQMRVRTFKSKKKAKEFAEPWVFYEIVEYDEKNLS